jgi:DNA-binding FadR family transcriptional regulator
MATDEHDGPGDAAGGAAAVATRLAARAERRLKDWIESGRWAAGAQLPSERRLAAECGVARNTLRQALDRLAAEGWIRREHRRGSFLCRPPEAPAADLAERIAHASPEDLMELRLTVEPGVAALAATRASQAALGEIEDILEASRGAIGLPAYELWDARLHLAIFRAARNPLLIDYCLAINAARTRPRWHRLKQKLLSEERHATYDRQHRAIVHALAERDGEAARHAMHQHLATVRDQLLSTAS